MPVSVDMLLMLSEQSRLEGRHSEGYSQAAAALAEPSATARERCRAHALSASHQLRLGDIAPCIHHAQSALSLMPEPADLSFLSGVHCVLAMAYSHAYLDQMALQHATEALSLARRVDDSVAECWALSRAATLSRVLGYGKAHEYGLQALALAQRDRQPEIEFAALNNLASNASELADEPALAEAFGGAEIVLAKAYEYAEQALQLALLQGNAHRLALARSNLGSALSKLGRCTEARAELLVANEMARAAGFHALLLGNTIELCQIDAQEGRAARAIENLEHLLAQVDAEQDSESAVSIRRLLHQMLKTERRFEQALDHHEQLMVLELRQAEQRAGLQAKVLIHRFELDEARHLARQSMIDAQQERRRAQDLARQVDTDALTGLYNRRHADRVLPVLVEQARAGAAPLAAVVIDIDHFKRVNDTFGHAVGDRVLVEVAALLACAVRSDDMAARVGGEEFLVVLADTPLARARQVCERMRLAVEARDWTTIAPCLTCTISIGLAMLEPADSLETLVGLADAALYRAKSSGRNRVVAAPPR